MARRKHPSDRQRSAREPLIPLPALPTAAPLKPLHRWLVALLIAAAASAAYWNSLDCGLVNWDDKPYILENKLVTGDGGLNAIWLDAFQKKPTMQYYPLVWTTYWIEHRVSPNPPRLMHATQLVLHAATAVAVWFTLLALGAPAIAAAIAALLFALHPTNVASVTWLAERKNTLSGLFFWLALLAYVQYRRTGAGSRYAASLVSFLLALFAKTACLVLVPILLLTDRVLAGRWQAKSLLRAAPYALLSLIMGSITARAEAANAKSGQPIDLLLRPFVAAAALVHYLWKSLWPIELVGIYPRWSESLSAPRYWIAVAILVVAAALLIRFRKLLSPLVLWGIGVFIIAHALTLGLIHFNYLQYSFVADHYMYLPSVGLFLLVGLLLDRAMRVNGALSVPRVLLVGVPAIAILLALAALTIRQNRTWTNPETYWTNTLGANPDCFAGQFNLGNYYFANGRLEEARDRYLESVRIDPTMILTNRSVARTCKAMGRVDEAINYYRAAVEAQRRKEPTGVNTRVEYADYLRSLGRYSEALQEYEMALSIRPNHPEAARAAAALRQQLNAPRPP